jgi:hypothetical protein
MIKEFFMQDQRVTPRPPGVCIPWREKIEELPPMSGDRALVQKTWENIGELAYTYIWQVLLSF